jgi:hypothetical protein
MNKKILAHFFLTLTTMFFVLPLLSLAQTPNLPPTGTPNLPPNNQPAITQTIKIANPFKCGGQDCSLSGLLKALINNILLPIGGVVAAIMIMYAGFLFVTARGEPAQITKAKTALLYAVIGTAILLGAWTISQAIQGTINQLK